MLPGVPAFIAGLAVGTRLLTTVAIRIETISWSWMTMGSVLLALLKNGVNVTYIFDPSVTTPAFPKPVGVNDGTSYGLTTLMWALGITSHGPMLVVAFILTIIVLAVASSVIFRRFGSTAGLAISGCILWGPIGLVLLSQVGRHDLLTIAGGLALGLGAPARLWAVVGALLMVAGNPEQSLLATGTFLLFSWALGDRARFRSGLIALGVTIVGYAVTTLVVMHFGLATRTTLFTEMFRESMVHFARNAPLTLYATYGLAGVALVVLVLGVRPRRGLLGLVAITVPFVAGVVTADQTRVSVCIAAPMAVTAMILAVEALSLKSPEPRGRTVVVLVALAALLLPPVQVVYPGRLYSPYEYLVSLVQRRLGV